MFDTSTAWRRPPTARGRGVAAARGLVVLAGWYAVPIGAFVLWVGSLPRTKADGTCDGIGFGCSPNAHDTAAVLGIVYGLPLLVASLLVALVVLAGCAAVLPVRSGVLFGTLAALAGWAVAAGVAVLVVVAMR